MGITALNVAVLKHAAADRQILKDRPPLTIDMAPSKEDRLCAAHGRTPPKTWTKTIATLALSHPG